MTNGDASMQRDKIERFALAPFFDVVVIEGESALGAGSRRLPACHALGRPDTVMVDNLDWDVAAPSGSAWPGSGSTGRGGLRLGLPLTRTAPSAPWRTPLNGVQPV